MTFARGFGRSAKAEDRTKRLGLCIASRLMMPFDCSNTCYETWTLGETKKREEPIEI